MPGGARPMGKLTTHVLNLASGIPADGMRVELRRKDADITTLIGASQTNTDGRCAAPLLEGTALQAGRYSLTFHVADYFRSIGVSLAEPPFLEEVVLAFGISDPAQNYHVPLLVSPWSYSTYRGS
jgi:5-hydroxyisourate hydrolase